MDRRKFLATTLATGATASVASATAAAAQKSDKVRIIGVACSPRKGKTTATSVQVALDAAKAADPRIETQLIDLGGMNISGWVGGAKPDSPGEFLDDFQVEVEPFLKAWNLGGLIIGSPSYFRSMSALCKAFLERIFVLRVPEYQLLDKAVGVVSVGSYRNGGQELVIQEIQTALLCQEVMVVGGKPSAHQGATLWNNWNDDIMRDEFGIASAKQLGIRVAEAALKLQA